MNTKITILLSAFALGSIIALAGCVQVTGTRKPDGTLNIATHRFLWASEGITFQTSENSNGVFSTTLAVQKSNADAQALGAIAEGVAKGVASGVKP